MRARLSPLCRHIPPPPKNDNDDEEVMVDEESDAAEDADEAKAQDASVAVRSGSDC